MPSITAKRIEEINGVIDNVLKKYGLEIDETIVSENLIEIKIIPVIIRKPRKKITMSLAKDTM
jgi:histidinol phosphatase-like enzyme